MAYLRSRVGFALMGRSLLALQAKLCPTVGARVRLMCVYAMLVLQALAGRATPARARRLRIHVAGEDRDWWVADAMEVAALSEVFVGGEYGDFLPAQPRLIVDAGANVGSATLWFRERFPDARVIAVEPNPRAFERLMRNVGNDPKVELVNAALSDSDGKAFFSGEPMTPVGHLQDTGGPGAVEVETLTLGSLQERVAGGARIDMLKLDVEGAEWRVLASPLTQIGALAVEIHRPVPGDQDPDEALRAVADREGFQLRLGHSSTAAPENLRWLVRAEVPEPARTS